VTLPKGYKPPPPSNRKVKPYNPRFANLKVKLILYGIAGLIVGTILVLRYLF